jgi:hypothetical protein
MRVSRAYEDLNPVVHQSTVANLALALIGSVIKVACIMEIRLLTMPYIGFKT